MPTPIVPSLPPAPDAASNAASNAASETGFETALLEALPQLRGYIVALAARGPGAQDAEDLLQDLAAKALRYRHAYDSRRALIPWLRRAALHLVLDARRAATRRPSTLQPDSEPVASPTTVHSMRRDELEHLLELLDPLPRDLLLRFHRDGQSMAQIAAALQLPEGTVKSHLHRARRQLRTSPGSSPP